MKNIKVEWKKVIFAIAICLLFVPMVYLGVNTFFPSFERDYCYSEFQRPLCAEAEDKTLCMEQSKADEKELRECQKTYDKERKEYESGKYITVMIICILTSFVMLLSLDKSIIYGLFFGVVISAFIGTVRYIESKSLIGFFLMVLLFILILLFIQRDRSN